MEKPMRAVLIIVLLGLGIQSAGAQAQPPAPPQTPAQVPSTPGKNKCLALNAGCQLSQDCCSKTAFLTVGILLIGQTPV
jgi:hypothetical protein